MPNSRFDINLHFIWCTYNRLPLITAEFEQELYDAIRAEVRLKQCQTLALGGIDDHIHLLAKMNTRISPASFMKQVKGSSSHFVNQLHPQQQRFNWQAGYGVFSVSRSHVPRVSQYVNNQKSHHEQDKLWPEWEEVMIDE